MTGAPRCLAGVHVRTAHQGVAATDDATAASCQALAPFKIEICRGRRGLGRCSRLRQRPCSRTCRCHSHRDHERGARDVSSVPLDRGAGCNSDPAAGPVGTAAAGGSMRDVCSAPSATDRCEVFGP